MYHAIASKGILDHMERNNVQFVFVYGVDNIACRVADPVFIGCLKQKNGDCGVKGKKKVDVTSLYEILTVFYFSVSREVFPTFFRVNAHCLSFLPSFRSFRRIILENVSVFSLIETISRVWWSTLSWILTRQKKLILKVESSFSTRETFAFTYSQLIS